jgi:glycosyltransferase involved in cell wall biosynthesis
MKVSLVATVLDARERVGPFLTSIAAQTRPPDEIVIVDGGSTDGTLDVVRAARGVVVLEEPGASIARGRNLAIARSTHEVIAVADADCLYEPGWLAALMRTIEEGADVAMGWYEPIVEGLWDACLASVNLPLTPAEIDPDRFMPSARSVAFRREAIEAVGGYPEWLPIGEDMWVNHRWRERGLDLRFAPDAVARWPLRPDPAAVWRQYLRYARGDAHAGMYPERHALRVAVYGGLAAALLSRRRWPLALAALGGFAYARTPIRRAWSRLGAPAERAAAAVLVPTLMAWIDLAKLAGYGIGLVDRLRGRAGPQYAKKPRPLLRPRRPSSTMRRRSGGGA